MSNMSVPAAPVHMSMSHTNSHLLVVGYVAGTVSAVEISGTDASLTKITSISQHNGTSKCDPSTPAGGRYVYDLDSCLLFFSLFKVFFLSPFSLVKNACTCCWGMNIAPLTSNGMLLFYMHTCSQTSPHPHSIVPGPAGSSYHYSPDVSNLGLP